MILAESGKQFQSQISSAFKDKLPLHHPKQEYHFCRFSLSLSMAALLIGPKPPLLSAPINQTVCKCISSASFMQGTLLGVDFSNIEGQKFSYSNQTYRLLRMFAGYSP